jgi:hypothetical protein
MAPRGFERRVRLPKLEPKRESIERRSRRRYCLNFGLRYTLSENGEVVETGSGQLVDMSSSGLRFVAARPLVCGVRVDVSIDWPVLLDESIRLQLALKGVIVRVCGAETAVKIYRHGFKTRTGNRYFQLLADDTE